MELILASEFVVAFRKIVELIGDRARGKKIVYIPTAAKAEGWVPDYVTCVKPLEACGGDIVTLDLAGKKPDEVYAALDGAGVIYVGGGNVFYLLEKMIRSGFREQLEDHLKTGAIYVGSSAGSCVCCPDISFAAPMDDPSKGKLESFAGLGLIDFLIVPHIDNDMMKQSAQNCMDQYKGNYPLFALRDDQVLHVKDKLVEII
jgi:dipeptidase E